MQQPIPVGHSAQIRPYVEVLTRLGVPVQRVLEGAGLPPLLDCEADQPVSTIAEGLFLRDAARVESTDDFVWLAADDPLDQVSASLLRRLARVRTLYDALTTLCSAASGESSRLSLWLIDGRDDAFLFHRGSTAIGKPGTNELTLMRTRMLLEIVRGFTADDWSPARCVLAATRLPGPQACADLEISSQSLHPDTSCLVVPRALLANGPRPGFFTRALHGREGDACARREDVLGSLEALLRPYVSTGVPSLRDAASLAGVSRRTLQRSLSSEGTSYQEIIDRVRLDAAMNALAEPASRIVDVAISSGFRDQAHFTHFFKRKCGMTPHAYRRSSLRVASAGAAVTRGGADLQDPEGSGA